MKNYKLTRQKKILLLGGLLLLSQIIYFSDYISPLHWGHIKVSGLACTCPDEKVVNGQLYLRSITPDSLKKYDLDYSEIYVSDKPFNSFDPMGVDLYIIEGKVIGKERVYEGGPWHPKLEVNKWREVNIIKDWSTKLLFFSQVFILLMIMRKNKI
ncbi:hypothetical protein [Flammeovirga aprica]|uniref:Uncharacterized protein n=1 Tax=Flammeovirga aprica JL-4 TaxID=694437 RepID=A0A7X9RZ16_9BACT|nr:hypothetical protein [Flammeovirga aprica]NME71244.1 hypothetical protein [Flammeovirga aprica JL-4]